MSQSFLYQTDIPYASLMLSVLTFLGGFVAFGISFALSAAFPQQPLISGMPIFVLVLGYLGLLAMYRVKRSPGRRYDTSTKLLTVSNLIVYVIFASAVLCTDLHLMQIATTLCDLLMVTFYVNYFVICLVLWVRPNVFSFLALLLAVFTLHHGVTRLPN